MNATEVRNHIVLRLNKINDLSFLNALKTIIDSTTEENIFYLNDLQKKKLQESREQARQGEVIDNEKVFEDIESWLEEK